MADAAAGGRLEFDERRRDVAVLAGRLAGPESGRVGVGQPGGQHVGDAVAAFDGLDVPGERDEIAPEAVGGELGDDAVDITVGQGGLEVASQASTRCPEVTARCGCASLDLSHVSQGTPSACPPGQGCTDALQLLRVCVRSHTPASSPTSAPASPATPRAIGSPSNPSTGAGTGAGQAGTYNICQRIGFHGLMADAAWPNTPSSRRTCCTACPTTCHWNSARWSNRCPSPTTQPRWVRSCPRTPR